VGGVGKTRLAIQVAAEVLPRFRDGAWLCELGPLNDPTGLPDVLAAALSVQPRPGSDMAGSVVEALREKRLLLVLDNCEHVISAAARSVDAIVGACPEVRVLATSREGLGVRGERQLTVRSLDLEHGSVQLFADRATDAGAVIEGDDDEAAVRQICERLDGIPLAIELAASRTRMMSPPEIAARLDERFRLLTGGSRTAVERHQTLRQAVDWSYELLDPKERAILDRLGVFAGGFTLAAAEAVLPATTSTGSTCSTALPSSSTSRWSSPTAPAPRPATDSSRPSASTRWSGSTTRAPPTRCGGGTPSGASPSRPKPATGCSDRTTCAGSPGSPPSSTTCGQR
jgi:predicted ATPase